MNNVFQSRRDFLKSTAKVATVAAAVTVGAPLLQPAVAETAVEAPAHPFEYKKLDPAAAEKRGYETYFKGGCSYGVFCAIIGQLADDYGYPYNMVPTEMAKIGKTGFYQGSLCGSLGGAAMALGLLLSADDAKTVFGDLCSWYRSAELPIYQPELESVTSKANSVNCADSLSAYMAASGYGMEDDGRKKRCGGVTGDVSRKTVELLNAFYNL